MHPIDRMTKMNRHGDRRDEVHEGSRPRGDRHRTKGSGRIGARCGTHRSSLDPGRRRHHTSRDGHSLVRGSKVERRSSTGRSVDQGATIGELLQRVQELEARHGNRDHRGDRGERTLFSREIE